MLRAETQRRSGTFHAGLKPVPVMNQPARFEPFAGF